MTSLAISLFTSHLDRQPERHETTWPELIKSLRTPAPAPCTLATCEGKKCPHKLGQAWSPAVYPPGASRGKANVDSVTALALDLDHLTPADLAAAIKRIEPYRAIVHGSHNDGNPRSVGNAPGADRCVRVVIALNRPVPAADWPRFWDAAVRLLGVPADPATKDSSRLFFHPSVRADGRYAFAASDGQALDVDHVLAQAPPAEPEPPARERPTGTENEDRPPASQELLDSAWRRLLEHGPSIKGQGGDKHAFEVGAILLNDYALRWEEALALAERWNDHYPQNEWALERLATKLRNGREYANGKPGWIRDAWEMGLPFEAPEPRAPEPRAPDDPDDDPQLPAPTDEKSTPVDLAAQFIKKTSTDESIATIRRWRGSWYHWAQKAGSYREITQDQLERAIFKCIGLKKPALVREARDSLIAIGDVLIDHVDLPGWIDAKEAACTDPLRLLPCRNGLLDLQTGALAPSTPNYFSLTSAGCAYDSGTPEPSRWIAFLRDLWPDDPQSIELIQEWFGYMLSPDTRQQKILLLVGPKRSGKGTLMRILRALLGDESVAAPTLASLGTNFGLWPLIGRSAAIIGDARLSGRSDVAQVVERLLSLSGEDAITIDRKHRTPWTGQLGVRFSIVSNELPRLTDASGALASRMLVLQLNRSWFGQEDTRLTGALLSELPSILNWAIDGWRRLQERGHFVAPEATRELVEDLDRLSSPVRAFLSERTEPDPEGIVKVDDLYLAFRNWAATAGYTPASKETLGRDVLAAGVNKKQRRHDGQRSYVYTGIRLTGGAQ